MASNENQKAILVSNGCQTSDKQVQTHLNNEQTSIPTMPNINVSGGVSILASRTIPQRSVSAYSFREPNRDIQPYRAAPFPSLPSRHEVLEIKRQVEQEILRLKADLSSLLHERASYERNANVHLLDDSNSDIIKYRGLAISEKSINTIIAENKKKKEHAEEVRSLHDINRYKHVVEFPFYKSIVSPQKQNIASIFFANFLQKRKVYEHEKDLTEAYVIAKEKRVKTNQLIDEYELRVDCKSGSWPPEFPQEMPQIDDNMRLKWCAEDSPMILSKEQQTANCYYDTNGLVHDPIAAHNEYKSRLCWTEEETNIFIEKYRQHPKEFGKITAALPEKTHKDVIEFYYLKRYEFNLKQSEAAARKRSGKKKVISEGSTKKNY